MELWVLGSGSCELRPGRSSAAYALRHGGTTLVLDLGQGAWRGLGLAGLEAAEVDAVLISHVHPDHIADLLPLLFALRYGPNMAKGRRVSLVGHPGLAEVLRGLEATFGHWVQPPEGRLALHLLEPGQGLDLGPVRLTTAAARHHESSLAFRLEAGGRSVAYLGDSEAAPQMEELARGADLLVAHCAADDARPKAGHLGPTEAGGLAARAGTRGLLLSHFYSDMDPESAAEAAARQFGGPVWAAEDLMRVSLGEKGPLASRHERRA